MQSSGKSETKEKKKEIFDSSGDGEESSKRSPRYIDGGARNYKSVVVSAWWGGSAKREPLIAGNIAKKTHEN